MQFVSYGKVTMKILLNLILNTKNLLYQSWSFNVEVCYILFLIVHF